MKITGPLMSQAAAGTIGKAVTFGTWKGRPTVRTHTTPKNPNAAKQKSIRAMMKFLSQQWSSIHPNTQATWSPDAIKRNVSNYHAYMASNLQRWRSFLGISQHIEPTGAFANATTPIAAADDGIRMTTVTLTVGAAMGGWCALLFRKTGSAVTPAFENLIQVKPIDGTNDIVFTDRSLPPETYHYNFRLCSIDGKFESDNHPVDATATD